MINEDENVLTPLSSQKHPLSFFKGHGGDRVLPGMLYAYSFVPNYMIHKEGNGVLLGKL